MKPKRVQPFAKIRKVQPLKKGEKNANLKYVQDFLLRFGYLKKGSYKLNELDDMTSEALKKYQRANGKRATGEFNNATRQQMTSDRCGLPDMSSGLSFSVQCSWDKSELKFAFETGTNDISGSGEFQAVRNAFQTWASVVPLTFTEVALNQNPDIVIDWRPANDPDHSMVGGVLAHADFPPGCSVVTNSLPKPVHFDDTEHSWCVGAVSNAFDVETVALHEIGHILGLAHSNVSGCVMYPSVSPNFTKRALTADDVSGIQSLYPAPESLSTGFYTIQQKSNNRFMDAYESSNDYSVVTRAAQNNNSQRWKLTRVGGVYTMQQKVNNRFIDAHETSNDFSVVTRTEQQNNTQKWVLIGIGSNRYTIQQMSNRRYMDAHEVSKYDYNVVTRPAQNNNTQRWILNPLGNDVFTIQQRSNYRYLDAWEAGHDFSVVTRANQNNDSQRWKLKLIGGVYTIQQKSNNRYLDAHESSSRDYSVVTRAAQNNDTQRWIIFDAGNGAYTIQQLSGIRFLDAHESSSNDYSIVTRTAQNNNTQKWLIKKL